MLTLSSNLARTLRLFADRPAIRDPVGCFTWEQFAARVARAAGLLRTLGIGEGQRFAILCRNGFRNAEIMHAGYWLGAVPVPVNYRLAPPEIAYILRDADCALVAVEDVLADLLGAPELAPWADRVLLVDANASADPRPGYEQLLAGAVPVEMFDRAAEEDDALLIYTGGTTGRAKGVRLSHRNILLNAMQLGLALNPRQEDVFLHAAPMFHSADLLANPYTLAGAAHVFLPKFSASALSEAIARHGVTCTVLTPTMLILALQDSAFGRENLSGLRQIVYGSSPMAAEWIRRALDGLRGVEFLQAYGLTETSPILTVLSMADHRRALSGAEPWLLKSVGRPLTGVDMHILDEDGREVPPGEPGEVAVRAPNVTKGYLNRPDATAEAFRGGWFHTGDIGRMDERGYLYLLDRKKDMIITGGENVYSLEVEAALYEHPDVQECAVFGVPDEIYGEALLAAVVPTAQADLTDEELIAHCRRRIGGYKIPRRYVFLDALPKSAMNKVLKHELRRLYANDG